jgi:hypothetical protein
MNLLGFKEADNETFIGTGRIMICNMLGSCGRRWWMRTGKWAGRSSRSLASMMGRRSLLYLKVILSLIKGRDNEAVMRRTMMRRRKRVKSV